MTPPPKSQTVGQIHAAKLRHEGTNQSLVLNYRDWMSGATSGRGRNIFLDILFIERYQALAFKFRLLSIRFTSKRFGWNGKMSVMGISQQLRLLLFKYQCFPTREALVQLQIANGGPPSGRVQQRSVLWLVSRRSTFPQNTLPSSGYERWHRCQRGKHLCHLSSMSPDVHECLSRSWAKPLLRSRRRCRIARLLVLAMLAEHIAALSAIVHHFDN